MEFTDLTLTNGTTAEFKGVDDWSRPYYQVTYNSNKYLVCCTELDGTYLHYYCPRNDVHDGEPDHALPKAFQPVSKS